MIHQLTYLERANRLDVLKNRLEDDAKRYITDNCHKVTDWSDIYLDIKNGNNSDNPNKLEGFMYAPLIDNKWGIRFPEFFSTLREDISVKTVTDPVHDTYDGDFSITVNGLEWWWIDYDSVINLAKYIERSLNPDFYNC